jgi:hypothetical protein
MRLRRCGRRMEHGATALTENGGYAALWAWVLSAGGSAAKVRGHEGFDLVDGAVTRRAAGAKVEHEGGIVAPRLEAAMPGLEQEQLDARRVG